MVLKLAYRMLSTTDLRLLWKFAWNFGLQGMLSIRRFHRRIQAGRQFPPFLFLSITNRCNLLCQGCWVTTTPPHTQLAPETVDRIIGQSARQGTRFFGIMGGEPLLHSHLPEIFEAHKNCYFQLFTNGTLMTDEIAARLRRAGNVTPLISVEGTESVSDERRGGRDVYARTLEGVDCCLRNRLITGVATSVCKTNIDDLVHEDFLDALIRRGVHYVWYYAFRPSGPNPAPHLALEPDDLIRLRQFVVDMRCRKPIIIVETYYNDRGEALCPAAEGISYHVNPWGDIEPCPPIQFSRENVHDADDVVAQIEGSQFLRDFRSFAAGRTRGCILLEDPDALREFMVAHGAKDATARDAGLAELTAMTPRTSQHLPGREIPEKHWAYRFAKKHWFFGFGGYA